MRSALALGGLVLLILPREAILIDSECHRGEHPVLADALHREEKHREKLVKMKVEDRSKYLKHMIKQGTWDQMTFAQKVKTITARISSNFWPKTGSTTPRSDCIKTGEGLFQPPCSPQDSEGQPMEPRWDQLTPRQIEEVKKLHGMNKERRNEYFKLRQELQKNSRVHRLTEAKTAVRSHLVDKDEL